MRPAPRETVTLEGKTEILMTHDFTPRLMAARAAAKFLGISESKLRSLDIPRKTFGGNMVWDRTDLDAYADSLPYEGKEEPPCNVDQLFGVAR